MKWISVEKELPNLDFEVLVCDAHGHVSTGYVDEDSDTSEFFRDINGKQIKYVLFWMPLPAPPLGLQNILDK